MILLLPPLNTNPVCETYVKSIGFLHPSTHKDGNVASLQIMTRRLINLLRNEEERGDDDKTVRALASQAILRLIIIIIPMMILGIDRFVCRCSQTIKRQEKNFITLLPTFP